MRGGLALCLATAFLSFVPLIVAQSSAPSPTTYTVVAEAGAAAGPKMTITIYRDGSRERVETKFGATPGSASLYDFAAQKVYWIGWSGEGSCSSGRYLSKRAPVDYDPITGATEQIAKAGPKSQRKAGRSEAVNGIPARVEEFVPAPKAGSEQPARIWIADPGNFLAKVEMVAKDGKAFVPYEIKQFSTTKPSAALFAIPANCVVTNSEMDDSGRMSSHAEATVDVKTSGTKKLGSKK